MWSAWWAIPLSVIAVIAGIVLVWLALLVAFWIGKPDDLGIREAARLALPIDLIPDFIPILGCADDAILVAIVLRSVSRSAGPDSLAEHWPGTPEGLAAMRRLCRLPDLE
jgi:hypothetical protein